MTKKEYGLRLRNRGIHCIDQDLSSGVAEPFYENDDMVDAFLIFTTRANLNVANEKYVISLS